VGRSHRIYFKPLSTGTHYCGLAIMARPLKKETRLAERKPARAKVTREEFLKNIKAADEWRKKRLAKVNESSR
jgi:hypothetical protein